VEISRASRLLNKVKWYEMDGRLLTVTSIKDGDPSSDFLAGIEDGK
tara:strand:+ start:307 stop:444 length:138 start_codon:yes stop_codon:yes gene_type:complete